MDPAAAFEAEVISRHRHQMEAMDRIIERGDSDIQRFYDNAVVFVTGGSGFLGKLLLEKLFRTCNIKMVFMLIRSKKGKSGQDRLDVIFNDPLFNDLKRRKPHFADRVVPVCGDIGDLRLGISDLDRIQIVNEVDVIFHVAATTKFNEHLRTATLTNVRGTRDVIDLAKQCKGLRACVHVSTAYAHALHNTTEVLDQFGPSPIDPDLLIEMAEAFDSDTLDAITDSLLKKHLNTYTLTKAVAEEVVRRAAGDLPVCVVRPGVVVATHWDPTPGWMDISCAYSATGLIIGPGCGVMRVLLYKTDTPVGLIPGDIANNVTIAAGWKTGTMEKHEEARIFTVSSTKNPVTMGTIVKEALERGSLYPSPITLWYIYLFHAETKFTYNLFTFFLHYIPAYILDVGCMIMGKGRPCTKIYNKIDSLSDVLRTFSTKGWVFDNSGVEELSREMSQSDRLLFDMDIQKVDWIDYIIMWCLGTRKYIVKDGLKGTEYALKKQVFLRIANYLVAGLCIYCFYKLSHYLFF